MNHILILTITAVMLSLLGCNKPQASQITDDKSKPGLYGDDGIQREKEKPIDEKIETKPPMPDGNPEIIIVPPKVNMPADIVPKKPAS